MTDIWFEKVVEIAKQATCRRSKCGSIVVKDNQIIGKGFNSPPGNDERQRRCECSKDDLDRKVTDKTCCVHVETRAILDALRRNSDDVASSTLYFVRLDKYDKFIPSGKPYCTICSKLALDVGISFFVLWHKESMKVYDTAKYNLLSYRYRDYDALTLNV
jgi:deoxycytidylate deaminase